MSIISGIKSGAVLQRGNNNKCNVSIYSDSDEKLETTLGKIDRSGDKWQLSDIPVGGPYSFTIYSDSDKFELNDIYVGDVWLLGGQSNMEGAGDMTDEDFYFQQHPDKYIRAFYMEDEWREAKPLLHRLWNSKDAFIAEKWRSERRNSIWKTDDTEYEKYTGVGPGFSFAKEIYEITGVPQGVIPCGIGGSSLSEWNPFIENGENYYTAMMRRFKECGCNVRGLYWDQGESEFYNGGVARYLEAMKRLIEKLREDTKNAVLPVVINQISRTTLPGITDRQWSWCWTAIREKQRILPDIIPFTDCVSTANAELSDLIHKSSRSQHEIGKAAALGMCNLCGTGGSPSLKFKGVKINQNPIKPFWYCVDVYYDNLIGKLTSYGYPYGFSVGAIDDEDLILNPYKGIRKVKLFDDFVRIEIEKNYEETLNSYLWYCLGNNAICTITDGEKRSLPAMGEIKIKDYLL